MVGVGELCRLRTVAILAAGVETTWVGGSLVSVDSDGHDHATATMTSATMRIGIFFIATSLPDWSLE